MRAIRSLDFFPKMSQDIEVSKSLTGGLLFLFSAFLTAYLVFSELNSFLYGDPYPEPYIESSHSNDRVRVNMNLTFFELPCAAISLDYQDITGTHIENVQHTLYKLRITREGIIQDEGRAELVREFESAKLEPSNTISKLFQSKKEPEPKSTSCYGAEMYVGQTCITCQDVMNAYLLRGWPMPPLDQVDQCKTEAEAQLIEDRPTGHEAAFAEGHGHHHRLLQQQQPDAATSGPRRILHSDDFGQEPNHMTLITQDDLMRIQEQIGEGCQLYGHLFVRKVPGNFHVSIHGKGLALTMLTSDVSLKHKVNLLEFTHEHGEVTLGRYTKATNSLDGKAVAPDSGRQDIQYYLKIVSSSYFHPVWGEEKFYEFVALQDYGESAQVPKVEFKYEFDPISIKHRSHRSSLTEFIVSLCAIVGGIFASSLLIGRVFEKFEKQQALVSLCTFFLHPLLIQTFLACLYHQQQSRAPDHSRPEQYPKEKQTALRIFGFSKQVVEVWWW
eukprot:TRINITY_DN795_c0_g1_i2.p1 TRINITY_DN795_c0_g1~~TRINITY_DN795_c0_g1_i2.p1  ORF type:complete len:499 (-),score=70.86 TRINITY_DN795_c0_g1_i2:262-1758(-)